MSVACDHRGRWELGWGRCARTGPRVTARVKSPRLKGSQEACVPGWPRYWKSGPPHTVGIQGTGTLERPALAVGIRFGTRRYTLGRQTLIAYGTFIRIPWHHQGCKGQADTKIMPSPGINSTNFICASHP